MVALAHLVRSHDTVVGSRARRGVEQVSGAFRRFEGAVAAVDRDYRVHYGLRSSVWPVYLSYKVRSNAILGAF